ncbi:aspartate kinase [PVC group bacterium (ex Bugula neritina AB1)]|nr:aspartate kinase [PVC group bacterium (ex Bugula neritina AB1)]
MRPLIVQKYGGSSLATSDKIKNVAYRLMKEKEKDVDLVVVLSAMGKTTDTLISLAQEISPRPCKRELDMLLSTGEQVSVSLLSMAIKELGGQAISLNAMQANILTDSFHSESQILDIDTQRIKTHLQEGKIVIITGYQGLNKEKDITTLGRGGSDLSAVALAVALKAQCCKILTDVSGVYTADPRIVSDARCLKKITYEEMLELASMGAKVLHARSVELAQRYDLEVYVKSSFDEQNAGTLIEKDVKKMEEITITGVALNKNEAKVTLVGVPDRPGMAAEVFTCLAEANINIDIIIQNVSVEGFTDISFTVKEEDLHVTILVSKEAVRDLEAKEVIFKKNVSKLTLVGVGMRRHSGIAAKMFRCLADKNINIEMISTSEIKISCVIDQDKGDLAVQALHKAFELEKS